METLADTSQSPLGPTGSAAGPMLLVIWSYPLVSLTSLFLSIALGSLCCDSQSDTTPANYVPMIQKRHRNYPEKRQGE